MGQASAAGGTWSVSGDQSFGTISQSGLYSAPSAVPSATVGVSYTLGDQKASAQIQIRYALPVLSVVNPSVLNASTSQISLQGNGFSQASTVLIGKQPVASSWVDGSHMTVAVSPSQLASTSVTLQVQNPAPGGGVSQLVTVPIYSGPLVVNPSPLTRGTTTLTLSLPGIGKGSKVQVGGQDFAISSSEDGSLTATGYLPPWNESSVKVSVTADDGITPLADADVPLAPTGATFDAAARFSTQAAWGPRPDVVSHIQSVGLESFINEQMQAPAEPYPTTSTSTPPIHQFFLKVVTGNSLLRLRTAWAFQTFITGQTPFGVNVLAVPWESTLERDAFTNFRKILADAASDPNVGSLLSLPGNVASSDPNVHPDQNFAREWMQLFSIGTVMLNDDGTPELDSSGSPIPSYNNDTVIAMSRVLTGWNYGPVKNPDLTFRGTDFSQPLVADESQHDHGSKVLFGTVQLPAGQTAQQDLDAAIDAIMAHQNTAPFVSRILIQRFVKSQPTPAYVRRVANVFKDDGTGQKGNLAAVVRAILLDPEARAGDTEGLDSDGFLHDPVYTQTFLMSVLQISGEDDQPNYINGWFNENLWIPSSIFSYFSPSYIVPGSNVNSPEFQLLTTFSSIQQSELLYSIVTRHQPGFNNFWLNGWLYDNFTNIPTLIEALNHLLYHGSMPEYEKTAIANYCNQIQDPELQRESAVFLALNGDSYVVSR